MLFTSDRNHIQTSSRLKKKQTLSGSCDAGVGLTYFLDLGSYLYPVFDFALFCVASLSESLSSMGREDVSQKPQAPMVLPAGSPY